MALLKFKRSAVPAKIPSIADLDLGELAINTYDGKVYTKKDDGTQSIVEVGGGSTTLGTMATQDADAVAITGGTITGVTMDSITNHVGADHIHYKVKATQILAKGDVVKVVGFNAGEDAFEVAKISASTDIAVGVIYSPLASGEFGSIINTGLLEGIDTSAFAIGTTLYPNTTGGFTSTKPTTGRYQALAFVVRSHANQGTILIEASEPQPTSLSQFTNDSGYITGINSGNVTTALGYTPANKAGDTFTGGVYSTGQIRAAGWWGDVSASATGLGVEIGESGGRSYVISYSRDTAAYGPMSFEATDFTFTGVSGGFIGANTSVRAPIFYDSNNTAYYVDPASTSTSAVFAGDININAGFEDNKALRFREGSTDIYGAFVKYTAGDSLELGTRNNSTTDTRAIYISRGANWAGSDGSFRAPLFYDNNDTAYFIDPNSTSRLSVANVNFLTLLNDEGLNVKGIRGQFAAGSDGQGISLFSNVDIGYPSGWGSGLGNTPSRGLSVYGGLRVAYSGSGFITSDTSVRSPIFYDSDNTGYYLDPASTGLSLYTAGEIRTIGQITNGNYLVGGLQSGALNIGRIDLNYRWEGTNWGSTSTLGILANCDNYWEMGVHDSGTRVTSAIYYDGPNNRFIMGRDIGWGPTFVVAASSFRAPIFYDNDNTGYYLDPASTSNLVGLTVANTITGSITGTSAKATDLNQARYVNNDFNTLGTSPQVFRAYSNYIPSGGSYNQPPNGAGDYKVIQWGDVDGGTSGNWGGQIVQNFYDDRMWFRRSYGTTWQAWREFIHDGNYTSYAMPSGSSATNSVDVRAPIFYDSNDTSYSIDPNGNSRLLRLSIYVGQEGTGAANSSVDGLVMRGNYNSNTWAHKFHKFDNGGGVPLYLSATVGDGVWTARQGWGSGLAYISQVFGSFGADSVYSPIFYDSNNTGYYIDAASTSVLNTTFIGTHGKFYDDGNFHIDGITSPVWINSLSNNTIELNTQTSGYVNIGNSARAPIFYDSNDTSYYVDANSTSVLNGINVWGEIGARRNDVQSLLRSYNLSAGGPQQFYLDHNYGNVNIGNSRGVVYAGGTYWEIANSVRAPIFYDSNDTGRYLDPNSTSNLYRLSSYIAAQDANANWNTGFTNTPAYSYNYHGDLNGGTNAPAAGWWFYESMRHSNASNYWGTQIAWGWEDNANRLWQRNVSGGGFGGWVEYLNTSNRTYSGNLNMTGSIISTASDVRAPIFYDQNNTGYYINPASNATLANLDVASVQDSAQYYDAAIEIRERSFGGVLTTSLNNAPRLGFHWGGRVAMQLVLDSGGTFNVMNGDTSGYSAFRAGDFFGNVFYETSNNAFYLDPASTGTSLNVAGSIVAAGNVTAYSDIRVKANVETIPSALDKLDLIRGVTYTRTDLDDKEQRYAGVIAQEIEAVLPEAVRDLGNVKAVDYNATIALLIQAVKELRDEVEALRK